MTIHPTSPDAAAAGIEAIYAEMRGRVGAATAVDDAVTMVSPGIAVVPLRTPTLPPATHTGCYLVGGRSLVVIDPASPWPDEQDRLTAAIPAGATVALIALTHHHGDHVGAAVELSRRTGAPIAAHPLTAARLAGKIVVTRSLLDGEQLVTDTVTLRAWHTPGHAPGHLVFADESSGAVIAGDLVAGVGTILIDPGPGEGHMATYLASLERVLGRGLGALLPAHGPMIADGPGKLREYLSHRRMREERVAAALDHAPRSLGELCAIAYADTPAALYPIAERSLLAHLVKLGEDRRAVAVDEHWRRA